MATERDVSLKLSTKADAKIGDGFKRLQQEAEAANKKLKQLSDQGGVNVEKLSSGFGKLASGVVILTAKNADLQKTINTLLSFKAVADIFGGIKDVVVGVTAKLLEYRAAALAAAAANSALAASGAGGTGAAAAKEAVAGAGGFAVGRGTAALGTSGKAALGIGGTIGAGVLAPAAIGILLAINKSLDKVDKGREAREFDRTGKTPGILKLLGPVTDLFGLTDFKGIEQDRADIQKRSGLFKQLSRLGSRSPVEEEIAQQRLSIRKPFEDRFRSLRQDQAKVFDQTAADRQGLSGTGRDLFTLERERGRVLAEQLSLTQQIAKARTGERLSLAEQVSLQDRLGQTTANRLRVETDIIAKLREQREAKAGLVREALGRVEDQAATFGGLNPLQRQGVLSLGRKIAQRGGIDKLSEGEQEFIRSGPAASLFADPLRRAAIASADKTPGFQQFLQQTGQDVRASVSRAEQVKIELEKKVQVELSFTDQAILDQIQKRVVPAIQAALAQIPPGLQLAINQAAAEAVTQQLQELQASRRAATGR